MFITKAQTLSHLKKQIKSATILQQFTITQREWKENADFCLFAFEQLTWSRDKLIVRSSGIHEDTQESSLAGRFLSLLHIKGRESLFEAIERVMQSFDSDNLDNQVLIQPLVENVKLSGVAFTKIPSSGAPYYLINYDDLSGRTNTVTVSCFPIELKTFYCHRTHLPPEGSLLRPVILMLKELEEICQSDSLDVEFAMTQSRALILFQVRPLKVCTICADPPNVFQLIPRIKSQIKKHPKLLGETTVFGIMPDWNPAEMIGVRPKPLARTLYQMLITDQIWADQRYHYGYRDVRGEPLLVHFFGQPYIDVRASLNSFIPRDIEYELGEKIVNAYLNKLKQFPAYHDKMEFNIVYSCFSFDLRERLETEMRDLSQTEIDTFQKSLTYLTNQIIHPDQMLWRSELNKIEILKKRNRKILQSTQGLLSQIYWLLEDCKKWGTLPFAGLARSAFIATDILRSLQRIGILSKEDYRQFFNSLSTIGTQLSFDLYSLNKKAFIEKYGYLRPGTYDLLSKRYDETPDTYFNFYKTHPPSCNNPAFSLSSDQEKEINTLLRKNQIEHTATSLMKFIAETIKGREYAKFVFSKNISDVLRLIEEHGSSHGLSSEDCTFIDIIALVENGHSSKDLHALANRGKDEYSKSLQLHLPPLIFDEDALLSFHLPHCDPTFITLRRIHAKSATVEDGNLVNKVVFIPSADPGYDWIFTKRIAGFVTMHGGANSHMAIRATELNLPAIIGAGETLYQFWKESGYLDIDCANKRVAPLIR